MKTHKLKLDIKYFDDVKSGKMNFNVRKNDRDFQVGDVLELKAYGKPDYFTEKEEPSYLYTGNVLPWLSCVESVADTITAKVTEIYSSAEYNSAYENSLYDDFDKHGITQSPVGGFPYIVIEEVHKILQDYFHADRLPNNHVVLGIEVVK